MAEPNDPNKPILKELTGRIGKYEIVRPLGKGAMGQVYLAHDTVLDRDVALKVMVAQIADDPELKARFEREARAVAKMTHPNVVTVFDLGSHTDGSPYIAMELLKGQDLQKAMRQTPPMTLERKVAIIVQVLAGLAHAHQAGIVHRDIKPANIFIQDDGSVKIMDFGVARADRRLHDRHRQHRGDGGLHVPRAGAGQEGRRAQRPLQRRLHALRARGRAAALPLRQPHGDLLQDHPRGGELRPDPAGRRLRRPDADPEEGARQGHRRALPDGLRVRGGPARVAEGARHDRVHAERARGARGPRGAHPRADAHDRGAGHDLHAGAAGRGHGGPRPARPAQGHDRPDARRRAHRRRRGARSRRCGPGRRASSPRRRCRASPARPQPAPKPSVLPWVAMALALVAVGVAGWLALEEPAGPGHAAGDAGRRDPDPAAADHARDARAAAR